MLRNEQLTIVQTGYVRESDQKESPVYVRGQSTANAACQYVERVRQSIFNEVLRRASSVPPKSTRSGIAGRVVFVLYDGDIIDCSRVATDEVLVSNVLQTSLSWLGKECSMNQFWKPV